MTTSKSIQNLLLICNYLRNSENEVHKIRAIHNGITLQYNLKRLYRNVSEKLHDCYWELAIMELQKPCNSLLDKVLPWKMERRACILGLIDIIIPALIQGIRTKSLCIMYGAKLSYKEIYKDMKNLKSGILAIAKFDNMKALSYNTKLSALEISVGKMKKVA